MKHLLFLLLLTFHLFANIPQHVITESKSNGTEIHYTYGNDLLSDGVHNFLTDALGSTRGLVDSTGQLTDSYSYTPYGELIHHEGTSDNSFLYTGEQLNKETGDYYLRARYYSPALTRFLSRDTYEGTIADPLSQNRYLYAGGNPIRYTDPSGRFFTMSDLSMAMNIMSYMRTSIATSFIVRAGAFYGIRAILNLQNFILGGPVITLGTKNKITWGFWKDLPKVVYKGTEYALVRGKLYAEHAVYRMTPNGFGGRGIPSMVVENATVFGRTVQREIVTGGIKYVKVYQNIKVVFKRTMDGKEVIITVIKLGSKPK